MVAWTKEEDAVEVESREHRNLHIDSRTPRQISPEMGEINAGIEGMIMFNFGLRTVLLTLHNAWIISLDGGWRGMMPTRREATYIPCFFKHDREEL